MLTPFDSALVSTTAGGKLTLESIIPLSMTPSSAQPVLILLSIAAEGQLSASAADKAADATLAQRAAAEQPKAAVKKAATAT